VPFFAPDRLRKRAKDWGRGAIGEKVAERWLPFVEAARHWLVVEEGHGQAALEGAYRAALEGAIAPDIGRVVVLGSLA
jgi:hypothetical protein